jgi:hypothetical protein
MHGGSRSKDLPAMNSKRVWCHVCQDKGMHGNGGFLRTVEARGELGALALPWDKEPHRGGREGSDASDPRCAPGIVKSG